MKCCTFGCENEISPIMEKAAPGIRMCHEHQSRVEKTIHEEYPGDLLRFWILQDLTANSNIRRHINQWQTTESGKTILIVAMNRARAKMFAREHEIERWKFIHEPDDLKGRRDCRVVFLPGWERHPYAREISEVVERYRSMGYFEVVGSQEKQEMTDGRIN